MAGYLYALIIYPLEMFIETVFTISMETINSVGYAIIFVSVAVQLLVLPIYKRADELQEEERERQKDMAPTVKHIKETFRGDERVMILSTFYRVKRYRSFYQFNAVLPLLFQIPFFMAAYNFLSKCPALDGASFYFIKNMGQPDGMISIGSVSINVLPIAMTLINIISGMIYTRGLDLKDKLQLYITAGVFLVLLYNSPSGLVFYWTLNNIFSLLKNIFMKLVKHPRPVISLASILFVVLFFYKCFQIGALDTYSNRVGACLIMLVGLSPTVSWMFDLVYQRKVRNTICTISKDDSKLFEIACAIAAITIGLLIPVTTIASSPVEFVIRGHYVNPLVQVLFCFTVALGIFGLWVNIFYRFCADRLRRVFGFCTLAMTFCFLVNSVFFKQHLFHMSNHMQYNVVVSYSEKEILINLAIIFVTIIACVVLFKVSRKTLIGIEYSVLFVVLAMTGYNTYRIQNTLNTTAHIKDDKYYLDNDAHFNMDKSGNNVLIFMLDRAFGQYIPYILNEKPELRETYSGFSFYPNTISHGMRTWVGAPAIFGGYEYEAYNVKDMDREDYYRYINDSLKVLPKIFSDNGYKCTVFDPPPYIDLNGTTIEEYYKEIDPSINAYYADGVMKSAEEAGRDYSYFEYASRRNFIRHSFFLCTPLFLRSYIYDDGAYLMQERVDDRLKYAGHIEALEKLPDMTKISDNGINTFTIIENDVTHSENVDLQMPEYTLKEKVDNSQYIDIWRDKLDETPGNRRIYMYTDLQIQSYGTNMATLLTLGKWIEFLKENDLYDNTRIILVGDHGFNYFAFDDMLLDKDGEVTDLEMVTPLLMVKDFGDGEFSVSDEFMTNADVPSIVMKGLIDDPINPYTGSQINAESKNDGIQFIFDNARWLTVHDDIYDLKNWDVVNLDFSNKDLIE